MTTEKECPVCKEKTSAILTDQLRRGTGVVFKCQPCDLGFLDRFIDDPEDYYSKEYRQEYAHKEDAASTRAQELFDIYSQFQQSRLDIILPYLNGASTLLEVGASAGQFLVHIQDKCKTIHALELDSDCAQFVRDKLQIDIEDKLLMESKFANNQYDIVCSFQVLEHTTNPAEFIADLMTVIKPGGLAFIEFPNLYDPLLHVWNVPKYQQFYYHKAHNFYFSETAIRRIVDLLDVDIKAIHFTQDYNMLNHINWVQTNNPQPTCLPGLGKAELEGHHPVAQWLNTQLTQLDTAYKSKLSEAKMTANMMVVLQKQ